MSREAVPAATGDGALTVLIRLLPQLLFLACTAIVVAAAFVDLAGGGNSWKQGDWLINNDGGFIRRGVFGSALLDVAALLGMNPVRLVVFLQVGLVLAVAGLTWAAVQRLQPRATLWLLLIGPGFFVRFWALDLQGGLRKELIAFLALALLAFAATRVGSGRVLALLATVIYLISIVAHEANIFLAPFVLACLYLMSRDGQMPTRDVWGAVGLTGLVAGATVLSAFLFRTISDHTPVCAPLLEVGVAPAMCDGAIAALERPLSGYIETTMGMILPPRGLSFATLALLNTAFVIAVGSYLVGLRRFAVPFILSALMFFPLFVVAVDWGRWVSLHTTACVFVLLVALARGQVAGARQTEMPALAMLGLTLFTVFWGFSHFLDVLWGGFARLLVGLATGA